MDALRAQHPGNVHSLCSVCMHLRVFNDDFFLPDEITVRNLFTMDYERNITRYSVYKNGVCYN